MTLPRVWWCPDCGAIKAPSQYDIRKRMGNGFRWCVNFGTINGRIQGSCTGKMTPVPVIPPDADWEEVCELLMTHARRALTKEEPCDTSPAD